MDPARLPLEKPSAEPVEFVLSHWRAVASWSFLLLALAGVLGVMYRESLAYLFQEWMENEDYGHGLFVPFITLGLLWWKRHEILATRWQASWWGLVPVLLGVLLFLTGELAALYVLQHLSFWLVVIGLTLAVAGPSAIKPMAFPLVYLLAMIPPPHTIQQSLSSSLQLLSSALGVGCLQIIGVTAFREGNVIDLGPIQLQVVEACSGLRYLFPLLALTLLCAYLFQDRVWKRVVLVLSAVPMAVLLNGARIGLIGFLVDRFGRGAAEGFMHAFEGWFLFVVSLGLLAVEMWVLDRIGTPEPRRGNWPATPGGAAVRLTVGAPALAGLGLLALTAVLSFVLAGREEVPPPRANFLEFPLELAGRRGTPLTMERAYIDALRFDDYLLADYDGPGGAVNVYAAYYRSQQKGRATHSPKTCIPGGGWEIVSLEEVTVPHEESGAWFRANRAVIQKSTYKQVVLYWFKQRHRVVTNEYLVKLYLLWDLLTLHRSDGALVRLVTAVGPGESERDADGRVFQMAAAVQPLLRAYVPD